MNNPAPPHWMIRLLKAACDPFLVESVLGDLQELFEERVATVGRNRANLCFIIDALGFIRPFALKKRDKKSSIPSIMFRNYFKITFRNLINNKIYSFINIWGLTISFACCLLIGLYLQDELSFDRYHTKHKQIYRLANFEEGASYENGIAKVCAPWGPEAKATIPEVKNACRFVNYGQVLVSKEDERFYENGGLFADSTVFNLFDWKMLEGDLNSALSRPNSVILTRQMAQKYFGNESPVGKSLLFDNQSEYEITGVIEDIPPNSHFSFQFLVSFDTYIPPDRGNKWSRWNQYYTYLLLRPNADIGTVENKLDIMVDEHIEEELAQVWTPFLQPIADIHLHSKLHREMEANSDVSYLYIFGIIAIFTLFIACTNFINLSTARSTKRAKEVGIRKVVGANRRLIIQQFLGESMFITFIAAVLSVFVAWIFIKPLNLFVNKQLELDLFSNPTLFTGLIAMTIIAGIISGGYPATLLSSFKPINVLKGNLTGSVLFKNLEGAEKGKIFRKGLVIFQFAIATFLIIATLVVTGQLRYIQTKNLGFNKEQIINIPMSTPETRRKSDMIKRQLQNIPGVLKVSVSANRPGGSDYGVPFEAVGLEDNERPSMRCLVVDEDFLDTYEMEIVEGRGFSNEMPTDSNAYLINEAAAKQLAWEQPVGQKLAMPAIGREASPIIGIVKDFNFHSLHEPINPLYFFIEKSWFSQFNVKLDASQIQETLAALEMKWNDFEPNHPFRYTFFDQTYGSLYASEESMGTMVRWLTLLAIFITCMGLFGLSTYMAERRTKEIGIRKVCGASVFQILGLLSKEILILVAISIFIAVPFAWLAGSKWLDNFAYNAGMGVKIYAMAAVLALGIALITVSYHTLRSALNNPVNSLRYE